VEGSSSGTTKPAETRVSFLGSVDVIFFYVDESGSPTPHTEPLLQGDTPLFCLTGVALDASRWREWDRGLFRLKRAYFHAEMERYAAARRRRPEHFEIKGHDLLKPSAATSRRNVNFLRGIFDLLAKHDARFFASVWPKDPRNPTDNRSIYGKCLQALTERFHFFCEERGCKGVIIMDSRSPGTDHHVASGHLSYLFGHSDGVAFTSIVEAPFFVNSNLSAGAQLADIIGACIYTNYYQRRCLTIPGYFKSETSLEMATPKELRRLGVTILCQRVPAYNYSHAVRWWPSLQRLQFRRSVAPPAPDRPIVQGYWGFRELC